MYLQNSDIAQAAPASLKEDKAGTLDNKIRFFGHPQSIFKHFASQGADGMTYSDFLRAMTPYNFQRPHDKKEFYLTHKHEVDHVMNIADVDGDGSISFNEFFFFVLVCQIPSKYFEAAFKKKGGKINAKDFHKILEANRKKIPFGQNLKLNKQQKDDYMLTCQEMINNIYNGRAEISFDEWMEFRNELQEMIWHYEFHQFDLD